MLAPVAVTPEKNRSTDHVVPGSERVAAPAMTPSVPAARLIVGSIHSASAPVPQLGCVEPNPRDTRSGLPPVIDCAWMVSAPSVNGQQSIGLLALMYRSRAESTGLLPESMRMVTP